MPVILFSCQSKGKITWFGKKVQNTTAYYNTYFNGKLKIKESVIDLKKAHTDDFRKIIEVYNYGGPEAMKGTASVMDEVLKKASKVIDRKRKSKWVDDSYNMMGEAYFYKADFNAAMDLFQYVYTNSKDKTLKYQSQIWVGKSLFFLGKYKETEPLINGLLQEKDFPFSLKTQLQVLNAANLIKLGKYEPASKMLEDALPNIKVKNDCIRYHYILGQLYQINGNNEKAAFHFRKVTKLNPDYNFAFHAKILLTTTLRTGNKNDIKQSKKMLKKMLKDDKNIEYYDQIYFALAQLSMEDGSSADGIRYYNLSIQNSKGNQVQLSTSYLALGNYYFKKGQFENAKNYFDSATLAAGNEPSPELQNLVSKNMLLSELVTQLIIVKTQDSLLRLSEDKNLLEKTIDKLIQEEKKKQNGAKPDDNGGGNIGNVTNLNPIPTSGSFPFYNPVEKARGYNSFLKQWGNRPLKDNWRLVSRLKNIANNGTPGNEKDSANDNSNQDEIDNKPPDRKKYYENIPYTESAKKEANEKLLNALFKSGEIYFEKFHDLPKAANAFSDVLARYPASVYESKSIYYLAKIFKEQNDESNFIKYKQQLKDKYPNSTYLRILEGKNQVIEDSAAVVVEDGLEILYRKTLDAFNKGDYELVKKLKDENDEMYAGSVLQSKFDFLLAGALLKTGFKDEGRKQLQSIVDDYPGTEIANAAFDLIQSIDNKLNNKDSVSQDEKLFGFILEKNPCYLLVINKGTETNKLRQAISDYNKAAHSLEILELSLPYSVGEFRLISISGFENLIKAKNYYDELHANELFFKAVGVDEKRDILISQEDLNALLVNNKIDSYFSIFNKKFGY